MLLQRGAARVIALDVGHGQLHARAARRSARDRAGARRTCARVDRAAVRARARHLRRLVHQRPDRAAAGARARAPGLGGARARQAAVRGGPRATSARAASSAIREVHRRVLREVAEAALAWPAPDGRRRRLGPARPEGEPGVLPPPRPPRRPRRCPMSSTTGSTTPSAEPVRTAAVVTHGKPETIGEALERLERVAARGAASSWSLRRTRPRSTTGSPDGEPERRDLAVVLGGDGTMLRALKRSLGTGSPVIGVNFGARRLPDVDPGRRARGGLARVVRGRVRVVELPDARGRGSAASAHVAVNDVVVASSIVGRMVELGWAVGGEDLGDARRATASSARRRPARPATTSRTAGRCSSGASTRMAVTFIAPHSLHARPLVVPRGRDVVIENRTPDVRRRCSSTATGRRARRRRAASSSRLGEQRSAARAPARGDVLPPLPGDLCFVGCASRTSS